MPFRDFLRGSEDSPTGKEWTQPWDDMTTAYGSQYPVLIGTAGITWELPVYSDISAEYMVPYGLMTQAMFIRDNKISMQMCIRDRNICCKYGWLYWNICEKRN